MTITIPTEDQEQAAFVAWFRATWPEVRIFAIPNGGRRSMKVANTLKATGVLPGVPDLFVPGWNLWIEMKRAKGGKLSPEQKDMESYLINECYHEVIVGHGFEDAKRQVLEHWDNL
jgi:hypothetical protein